MFDSQDLHCEERGEEPTQPTQPTGHLPSRPELCETSCMNHSSSPLSRRDFLASTARGALGLAAVPSTLLPARQAGATPLLAVRLVVDDPDGTLGRTRAPVSMSVLLEIRLRQAALEGRLQLREQTSDTAASGSAIPLQCLGPGAGDTLRLCWAMPEGPKGPRVFIPAESSHPARTSMQAAQSQPGGQFDISEGAKPVLRYNYAKVEPAGAFLQTVTEDNRKYAVARSNYIHPLYGPQGETLTKDWSRDHPHHRGIYWAWPEVDWRGQRADLHALQKAFARPTGKCETLSGPVFAQLDAENLWQWEDREPIVRERALIRAYPATPAGRLLDLEFHFAALDQPVLLARRGAAHYGGLNLRFNALKDQQISKHTDRPDASPRKSWGDLSGIYAGAQVPAGVAILQHASNAHFPGDWIDYPELNWLQPAFPSVGTRYELRKAEPLVLRFRLWIHPGGQPSAAAGADRWLAANSRFSPLS